METKRLVYKNSKGEIQRVFGFDPKNLNSVRAIYREDIKRVELNSNEEELNKKSIPFRVLNDSSANSIKTNPLLLGELGQLEFIENEKVGFNIENANETAQSSPFLKLLVLTILFVAVPVILMTVLIKKQPFETRMQEQVVKIVERAHQKIEKAQPLTTASDLKVTETKNTKAVTSVKRIGALGVLGQLQKGAAKGGLNLGAAVTSPGPGLGGTQGSGGIQTSLYGKGLTHAALGRGAVADGAGGIGTKGKGGGQAGYGTMSLVGSTGIETVSLAQEAFIEGGLSRDAIAAVIQKNIGQVRFCYEMGLQSDPSLSGRVVVDFTISPQGSVSTSSLANSSLNSQQVEDCILMRLRSWKFPIPSGNMSVKVNYPFVLKRVGS